MCPKTEQKAFGIPLELQPCNFRRFLLLKGLVGHALPYLALPGSQYPRRFRVKTRRQSAEAISSHNALARLIFFEKILCFFNSRC
jgi:hypothetical protein